MTKAKTKKPDSKKKKESGEKLDEDKKITNEKPISLNPVPFEEALKALMSVDKEGKPVKADKSTKK